MMSMIPLIAINNRQTDNSGHNCASGLLKTTGIKNVSLLQTPSFTVGLYRPTASVIIDYSGRGNTSQVSRYYAYVVLAWNLVPPKRAHSDLPGKGRCKGRPHSIQRHINQSWPRRLHHRSSCQAGSTIQHVVLVTVGTYMLDRWALRGRNITLTK